MISQKIYLKKKYIYIINYYYNERAQDRRFAKRNILFNCYYFKNSKQFALVIKITVDY